MLKMWFSKEMGKFNIPTVAVSLVENSPTGKSAFVREKNAFECIFSCLTSTEQNLLVKSVCNKFCTAFAMP